MSDYPYLRFTVSNCPLCGDHKDDGALACWPCYRAEIKDGMAPAVRKIFDNHEKAHTPKANNTRGVDETAHYRCGV